MHKNLLLFFAAILLLSKQSFGQCDSTIVIAEKNFVNLSVQHDFRSAFLENLDSNGVLFENGNILNGMEYYAAAKKIPYQLIWCPHFAGVSLSGDIGFTTGPFDLKKQSSAELVATGQYSSIWRKNRDGHWKLLVDLGIDFSNSVYDSTLPTSFLCDGTTPSSEEEWQRVEQRFIDDFQTNGVESFLPALHEKSWFNIQRQHPARSQIEIIHALYQVPGEIIFKPIKSEASIGGDFFYVYGQTIVNDRKENYLRVWIHTSAGWKIILQVIRWA